MLTAYGLRTLSPRHPDFKAYYNGNLYDRDAAYHQGTVWPWLIGPFIDAWLKVHPNEIEQAKLFLIPLEQHIDESCIGTINEIFDAGDPFHARGCIAQAWSVAEFLRCYSKLYPEFSHELKNKVNDHGCFFKCHVPFTAESNLPFKNATEILEYLNQLGISHCYFSPILQAKRQYAWL